MKNKVLSFFQIIINIALIPFYFIKLFHDVAHLPRRDEESGSIVEITKVDYYYTPFENLTSMDLKFLFILQIVLMVLSIFFIVFSIINQKKIYKWISIILFVINILFFAVVILLSSTVARGY